MRALDRGWLSGFKSADDDMKIEFPYAKAIRDYPMCDWTDDTDHLILVMQSLITGDMQRMRSDAPRVFAIYQRGIAPASESRR